MVYHRLVAVLSLVALVGCPHTRSVYDYEGVPPSATPSPTPTAKPLPPFPLTLVPTAGMLVYGEVWRLVGVGAARWNGALGEIVFKQGGRTITADIMNTHPNSTGVAIGEVDNLTNPHSMMLWVGISPPTDQAIVLHELGHLLGLAHSEASEDVMYFRAGFATDLSPNDIHRGKLSVASRRQQAPTTP